LYYTILFSQVCEVVQKKHSDQRHISQISVRR
jgi:hypothetical protein